MTLLERLKRRVGDAQAAFLAAACSVFGLEAYLLPRFAEDPSPEVEGDDRDRAPDDRWVRARRVSPSLSFARIRARATKAPGDRRRGATSGRPRASAA